MIDPKIIIDRIKAECAVFSGRVAGAAELAALEDERVRLSVPHAFVRYRGSDAQDAGTGPKTLQIRDGIYEIVVAVSNATDEQGIAAHQSLIAIDAALRSALLGWAVTGSDGTDWPLIFGGDEIEAMDRARLFHTWRFIHRTQIANL